MLSGRVVKGSGRGFSIRAASGRAAIIGLICLASPHPTPLLAKPAPVVQTVSVGSAKAKRVPARSFAAPARGHTGATPNTGASAIAPIVTFSLAPTNADARAATNDVAFLRGTRQNAARYERNESFSGRLGDVIVDLTPDSLLLDRDAMANADIVVAFHRKF